MGLSDAAGQHKDELNILSNAFGGMVREYFNSSDFIYGGAGSSDIDHILSKVKEEHPKVRGVLKKEFIDPQTNEKITIEELIKTEI